MARTIEQIKESITESLKATFTLSTSAAAEWRLWVHCVAYAIYMFELVLDAFKAEMDADAEKEVAGTLTWYNDKCYEFQMGHELVFDTVTGLLEYEQADEAARVIKIASVNVAEDGYIYVNNELLDEPYLKEGALGECDIEMPYQVPEGRIFVCGDNRGTSLDSRSRAVGCVSEEQIVGKIVFRIWPLTEVGAVE